MTNSPSASPGSTNDSTPKRAWAEIGLAALCLFLFFWRLGSIPLIDYDEALYVTCARQMVVSGDWITPRLNTRQPERPGVDAIPFFEKPILVYWSTASAMRVFGFRLWAARLPVALASLLTTLLVYMAGRRWFTRRAGLLAALVYATAPMTLLDARQMTTDALLVLWLTGALLCFRQSPKKIVVFFFWLFCALAVLTKGAVGLLLPFLVIGVFSLYGGVWVRLRAAGEAGPRVQVGLRLVVLRVLKANILRLRPLLGLGIVLAVAAPWHLLIAARPDVDAQARTWMQEYILRQHIGRFRGLDAVHNQPLLTFVPYFLVGFFPWACFVPAAFGGERLRGERKKEKGERGRAAHPGSAHDAANRPEPSTVAGETGFLLSPFSFFLVWFWTIFVFFSLGAAKLPTYITPAYPAAALLVGRWLDRALSGRRASEARRAETFDAVANDDEGWGDDVSDENRIARALQWGALAACGTGVLLLIAALVLPAYVPTRAPLPGALFRFARHFALLFTLGSGAAWLCFVRGRQDARWRVAGVATLAVMMTLFIGLVGTEGYQMADETIMGPYQQLAIAARPDARAGIPVVFYSIVPRRPSMLFYGQYSPLEHKETGLLAFLAPTLSATRRQADVIVPGRAYETLLLPEINSVPGATIRLIQRRGFGDGWVLARITVPPSYAPSALRSLRATPQ